MNRQREWQLENLARGLCQSCGREKLKTKTRCAGCATDHRVRNREYMRKKYGFSPRVVS